MRPSSRSTERVLRRLARLLGDQSGTASLEFITVGVLLLVPVVYLVLVLGTVQEQSLGVEAAARHAARAIATAADAEDASARTDRVIAAVAEEYGIDPASIELGLACADAARECPEAGGTLVVRVAASVRMPFVPPIFGLDRIAVVPVEATAVQKVSRRWGAGS